MLLMTLQRDVIQIKPTYFPNNFRIFFFAGGSSIRTPLIQGGEYDGGVSKTGDLNGMGIAGKTGGMEEEVHTTSESHTAQ